MARPCPKWRAHALTLFTNAENGSFADFFGSIAKLGPSMKLLEVQNTLETTQTPPNACILLILHEMNKPR
jgi:hypothetical protein